MGANEFHAQSIRQIANRYAKVESGAAFENIPSHFPNADPAVQMRTPKMFRELKQREPRVVARWPFEFREEF